MDALAALQFAFAPALATALLHSLWQDTLLAIAAAAALSLLARAGASLRHAVAMAFLLGMVLVPAMMEELLFDDILFGSRAREEHRRFQQVLAYVADEVLDVQDLLDDTSYTWHRGWNYVRFDPEIRQGHMLCLPRPRH